MRGTAHKLNVTFFERLLEVSRSLQVRPARVSLALRQY